MKNNKKIMIIITIILILLMILQIILYNKESIENRLTHSKNEIEMNQKIEETRQKYENSVNVNGINPVFDKYLYKKENQSITGPDFGLKVYQLLSVDMPELYSSTKDLDTDGKLFEYYQKNEQKINNYGIYDSKEMIKIIDSLRNIYQENGSSYTDVSCDTNSIKEENEYVKFNIDVRYMNEFHLKLKVTLSETKENSPIIKYESNSDLNQFVEKASNSNVDYFKARDMINSFNTKIYNIHDELEDSSLNKITEYYYNNTEDLNKVGIASANDFLNVMRTVNSVDWDSLKHIKYYKIDISNLAQDNSFYQGELIDYIGINKKEANFKMYIAKNPHSSITVKFVGDNGDIVDSVEAINNSDSDKNDELKNIVNKN